MSGSVLTVLIFQSPFIDIETVNAISAMYYILHLTKDFHTLKVDKSRSQQ